jgi:hypothetical protein
METKGSLISDGEGNWYFTYKALKEKGHFY